MSRKKTGNAKPLIQSLSSRASMVNAALGGGPMIVSGNKVVAMPKGVSQTLQQQR